MSGILKFFNENHMQAIAVIVLLAAGFYFYGCQSRVQSLLTPDKLVTRTELQGEVNSFLALAEARTKSLEEKDALRKLLIDQAALIGQGGQLNAMGALNTIVSVFAIGSALDSKRKVKNLSDKNTA
jgi:hypothetical protein